MGLVEPCYRYRARATRVLDGDTFIADVDLGFATERGSHGILIPIRVRIKDLWEPEMKTAAGPAAKQLLESFVTDVPLIVESYKDTKSMERWVCDVWNYTLQKKLAELMEPHVSAIVANLIDSDGVQGFPEGK